MRKTKILVVDDEPDMLETCRDVLSSDTIEVFTEVRSAVASKRIEKERFDLLLLDLKMPEMDGLALLKHSLEVNAEATVLIFTGFPTIETAVEAVKLGAFDYITKPFSPDQLRMAVSRAIEQKHLKEENLFLSRGMTQTRCFDDMIGHHPKMQKIFRAIEQISTTDSDILIVGDSGTGKELIAKSLHSRGRRRGKRFVPIDCGAIPENLLENELFGHERGAFTGAETSSLGLLEFAHEGILFLDEVCELHPVLQAKLLRVLQERQFRRIGGKEAINVDIQIITATNRDIDLEVKERRFRKDLFYRINVLRIEVPPLCERVADIPLLAAHFLELYGREWEKEIREIDPEAMEVLCQHRWPGNVRELQNVIKRAVILCKGHRITSDDFPSEVFEIEDTKIFQISQNSFFSQRAQKLMTFELNYFRSLLERLKGDVAMAAEEAKLPKGTLYRLLKKHHLKPDDFKS